MWATGKLDLVNARHSPESPETSCAEMQKITISFYPSPRVVKVSFEKVLRGAARCESPQRLLWMPLLLHVWCTVETILIGIFIICLGKRVRDLWSVCGSVRNELNTFLRPPQLSKVGNNESFELGLLSSQNSPPCVFPNPMYSCDSGGELEIDPVEGNLHSTIDAIVVYFSNIVYTFLRRSSGKQQKDFEPKKSVIMPGKPRASYDSNGKR